MDAVVVVLVGSNIRVTIMVRDRKDIVNSIVKISRCRNRRKSNSSSLW